MVSGDTAAVIAVALSLVDGVMTLPNWHLESNPVVLELGPAGMLATKLIVGSLLLLTWFLWVRKGEYRRQVAYLLYALAGLYAVVVVSNVAVLVG